MPPYLNIHRLTSTRPRLPRSRLDRIKIPSSCQQRGKHSKDCPEQEEKSGQSSFWYSYLNRHPNERKPPLPYETGSRFIAVACHPPKGVLKSPDDWYIQALDKVEHDIENLHPLEACLQHPPAEVELGTSSMQLRVIGQIAAGDLKNSQLVKVQASGLNVEVDRLSQQHNTPEMSQSPSSLTLTPRSPSQPAAIVAAKVYDSLYWDLDEERPDPFHNCDARFYLETLAYRDYLRPLYGTCVPHFWGSYTIDVPILDTRPSESSTERLDSIQPRTRPVRAILYEYIPGIALVRAMEEQLYNQSQRKAIMRAVLTAESKLRQADVLVDSDFHPRNVVVKSAEEEKPADIRLIDFGAAQCGERAEDEAHVPTAEPEPMSSIIERWRDRNTEWKVPANLRYDFEELVDWDWDAWLCNEYKNQPYSQGALCLDES